MLIYARLLSSLWPKVIVAACHITNHLLTKVLDGKILYEAWYKKNLI